MPSIRRRAIRWWRRLGLRWQFAALLGLSVLITTVILLQRSAVETDPGTSVLVLFFTVINLIGLGALGLLIGRNIVKLFFDRRRGILGSRLRTRLVVAFVGLTLIPTVLLFILASGMLSNALEGWFGSQVEVAVEGAVDVARLHFAELRKQQSKLGERMAQRLVAAGGAQLQEPKGDSPRSLAVIEETMEQLRKERELFSLGLFSNKAQLLIAVQSIVGSIDNLAEPEYDKAALQRALNGESSTLLEQREPNQFIRSYQPLRGGEGNAMGERAILGAIVSTFRIDSELSHAMNQVTESHREFQQLKLFKAPLKKGYLLPLTMLTGLIVFAAVWFAFYLSKQIVIPIQRLAEGTRAIAQGRLDFIIKSDGDDELAVLVNSFNRMTADLQSSKREIENRQQYLENILARLAVGVVTLNSRSQVDSINDAASELLGLHAIQESSSPGESRETVGGRSLLGVSLAEMIEKDLVAALSPLIAAAQSSGSAVEREISLIVGGRGRKLLCTAAPIPSLQAANEEGVLILLDDITELAKAQHMAAWREVARRVAHEIKNPLTPIQLSAQRIERALGSSSQGELVRECTQTIVSNVDSIKRLANEFSKFARMPTAELVLTDLNRLTEETLSPFAEHHSEVTFNFLPDSRLPELLIDREQMRRVIINLVDNAVAAIEQQSPAERGKFPGRVTVKTDYDRSRKVALIEVSDNGPGVPAQLRSRIFDPYVTSKESGTGLGLAIVTSILAEHHGDIRMYDNQPRGARFVAELPLVHSQYTQRRVSGGRNN